MFTSIFHNALVSEALSFISIDFFNYLYHSYFLFHLHVAFYDSISCFLIYISIFFNRTFRNALFFFQSLPFFLFSFLFNDLYRCFFFFLLLFFAFYESTNCFLFLFQSFSYNLARRAHFLISTTFFFF